MNGYNSSLFCTPELGLIKFYLKEAVDKSSLKCLKDIDKSDGKKLVFEFVVPAVEQCIKDCSSLGNWRDEKDYVLMKIHGWFFMSWMTTKLGLISETFLAIGTVFYSEILGMCQFQEYFIQCLANVNDTIACVLIQDITSNACEGKADLMLQLVQQCLLQLGSSQEEFGRILNTKLCYILTQIAKNVQQQWMQIGILSKLNDKMIALLTQLRKCSSYSLGNGFTEKMSIIEFNHRLSDVMDEVEMKKTAMKTTPKLHLASPSNSHLDISEQLAQTVVCLVSCINRIVTVEWKSLFHWQFNDVGCKVLTEVKATNCRDILSSLFTTCKSLQMLGKDLPLCNELQCSIDFLQPYLEQHETKEERLCIEDIISAQHDENESYDVTDEIGTIIEVMNGTVEDKLQHALYRVDENLLGDELCFEWLLLKEELYIDKRWLTCVETHAKKFVSIKVMKMLLDVLSVFQEFDIGPEGVHENIYISLKKVILDLLTCLTLPEQKEIVLYNFNLTCLHASSLFLCPDSKTSENFQENILTGTMNKLVKSEGFSKDVMDGIVQGCLVSPYFTLKELLTEASRRPGYERVVCELLQVIPWLVDLKDEDSLLIQVLKHQLLSSKDFSKKQEGQFLKLIDALMQPYVHPDFGTREGALVAASDITKHVVMPLLTDDVMSSSLPLHILMKCLSCGLISKDLEAHCSVDQDHLLQLLLVVLEIHEEIEQFWIDWQAGSVDDGTEDSDDATLLDVWDEMDVTFKIIEEHLVPFLTEDISREPHQYYSYVHTIQEHLNKLDWISSLPITPILQTDVFKECTIQLPSSLVSLIRSHFNVKPVEETGSTTSFWRMYFQCCAHSNEVFGIFLSKLPEIHSRDGEVDSNNTNEIIHNVANLLPFTTQTQWQRMLDMMVEMMKCGYLTLENEWKADVMALPDISTVDGNAVVNTSELLLSILHYMSKMTWRTPCVWIVALKNYISNMKILSLTMSSKDKFEVICHLAAHLAFAAFKIVPESFEERITIMLLDVFNQGLSCISFEDIEKSVLYLQAIINMVSHDQLRLVMSNTMDKMLSKNVSQ